MIYKFRYFFNSNIFWILLILIFNLIIYHKYFGINNFTNPDEYESLATVFSLLGFNWSEVENFHGYGATILLYPFLKLWGRIGQNYIFFIIESFIFKIISELIIFVILHKKFDINKINSFAITIVVGLGMLGNTSEAGLSAMTEIPLNLLTYIIIYFLLESIEKDGIKKCINLSLLSIFLAYGMTIHTRGIILYFSSTIILFISYIIKKKFYKEYCIIFSWPVLYWITSKITKFIKILAYSRKDGSANSLKGIMQQVSEFEIDNVNSFIYKIIFNFKSIIESYIYWSLGIIIFVIIIDIYFVIKYKNLKEFYYLWYMTLYGLICFFMMNFLVAYISFDVVNNGQYRWLLYIRYSIPFAGILVLTCLIIITKIQIPSKIYIITAVILSISCKDFMINIPHLLDTSGNKMNNISFNTFEISRNNTGTATEYFAAYTILMLFMFIIFNLKKNSIIFTLYLLFSLYVLNQQTATTITRDENRTELYAESLDLLQKLEISEIENVFIIGDNWQYKRCFESRVAFINDDGYKSEDDLVDSILFSQYDMFEKSKSVYSIQITDRQYVATKNKKLRENIINCLQ